MYGGVGRTGDCEGKKKYVVAKTCGNGCRLLYTLLIKDDGGPRQRRGN